MALTSAELRSLLLGINPSDDPDVSQTNWQKLKKLLENLVAILTSGSTGAVSRIAFYDSTGALTHSADFKWTAATNDLTLGGDVDLVRSAANVLTLASGDKLRVDDGAAATPVVAGTNYTTTGLFLASGPLIGFAVATAEILRIVAGGLTMADGMNIETGTTTGTKIGTGPTSKVALWGAEPVVQQAHIADPSGGATQDAEARAAIGLMLDKLEAAGLLATS